MLVVTQGNGQEVWLLTMPREVMVHVPPEQVSGTLARVWGSGSGTAGHACVKDRPCGPRTLTS